ncbi:MAG TPA: response regulator [Thermoanaerobaculia bacterium]|nr:response regulator [Thermoanaerobaculia bacterium]
MARADRVLIVEDDENVRLTMGGLLEIDGYDVVEAQTIADAITALNAASYDLVLLDLQLGTENALPLVAEARQTQPEAVVAILSGSHPVETEQVDLVIEKGTDPRLVLDQLRASLRSRREKGE